MRGGWACHGHSQPVQRFDPDVGGYRLNTDFGEVMFTLGRAFGFAFGHKENGADVQPHGRHVRQHALPTQGWC